MFFFILYLLSDRKYLQARVCITYRNNSRFIYGRLSFIEKRRPQWAVTLIKCKDKAHRFSQKHIACRGSITTYRGYDYKRIRLRSAMQSQADHHSNRFILNIFTDVLCDTSIRVRL